MHRCLFFAFVILPLLIETGDAAELMTFRNGCAAGRRIMIAAVGDILFHRQLQQQALAAKGSYSDFWQPVQSVLSGADIAYGNLEGPAAEGLTAGGREARDPGRRLDGQVYDSVLRTLNFNYHPSVVTALRDSGFKVIGTANNHAGDRGPLGIDRTVAAFEREGLLHTGTRRRGGTETSPWGVITEAKGVKVAWIACTYGLNGLPDRDRQALNCYRDKQAIFDEIGRYHADPNIDAIILTPHWGVENSPAPMKSDRAYASEAIDAGATAMIGAHPHVLQPWEKITAQDGREALIIYSNGNFISNQRRLPQRSGVIALLELTKPASGKAEVSAAGFIPTWVSISATHRVVEMTETSQESGAALRATLRLLPAGNRVSVQSFQNLPRACAAPPAPPDAPSETASPAPAETPAASADVAQVKTSAPD